MTKERKPKEFAFCGECMFLAKVAVDEMKKWGLSDKVIGECRKYAHHPGAFSDGWGKTNSVDWCGEGRKLIQNSRSQ